MNQCPVCNDGILEDQLVETWMLKGNHWVLFKNVRAMRCDLCGEKTFSQEVAARLAAMVDPANRVLPTSSFYCHAYDLSILDKAEERGEAVEHGTIMDFASEPVSSAPEQITEQHNELKHEYIYG